MKKFPIILGKLFYSAINLLYFLCEVIESNKMVELDIQNISNIKKITLSKILKHMSPICSVTGKVIVFYICRLFSLFVPDI